MASPGEVGEQLGRGKRRRAEGVDRTRRRGDQAGSGEAEAANATEGSLERSSDAAAAGSRGHVSVPAQGPAGGAAGTAPSAGPGEGADPVHALEEALECPVCFERMNPPIFQCANGHIVCAACKPKLKKHCPTCRLKLGTIRNLALEQLAVSLQKPCKYQRMGCTEVPAYQATQAHEAQCRHRPYTCPAGDGCDVTGSVDALVQHLKKDHSASITHKASFIDQLLDSGGDFGWTPVILTCDGHFFCVNVMATKREASEVYVAILQCMGEEDLSQCFSYRISMENKDNRLTWEGIPATARRSHDDMLARGEYFSVPRLMPSLVRKEGEDGVSLTLKYSVRRRR